MAGIGIITNPHAKLNKRNPERSKLLSYIAGSRGNLEITNNLEDLRKVAKRFSEQKIDTLAINGGDGTISRTITAFIHEYGNEKLPDIAVLRGGTVNVLADNLNIKGSPEQILYRLVEAHSLPSYLGITELSTLKVNSHYGFIYGNATSYRFLEAFYMRKTNQLGVLLLLARVILSSIYGGNLFRKTIISEPVTLESDNSALISLVAPFLFCSTVEFLPLKIRMFSQAQKNPDKFQCLAILVPPRKVPLRLPEFALNLSSTKKHKTEFLTNKLVITADSPSAAAYTLDGELFTPQDRNVEISLGPRLRFIIV
ncbi:MAG: hypothetical protein HYW48_12395 [Deltaproteobacteria bacterium]|nr:hypothetical protein [Deltaproteobacteria bacterium]